MTVSVSLAVDKDEVLLVLLRADNSPDPLRVLYVELLDGGHNFEIPTTQSSSHKNISQHIHADLIIVISSSMNPHYFMALTRFDGGIDKMDKILP